MEVLCLNGERFSVGYLSSKCSFDSTEKKKPRNFLQLYQLALFFKKTTRVLQH